ncbi:MAG: hypothetical protein QOF22_2491 [Bradyrhizobium sp.]|nr:hypothetical protein [Bradyrhizobium sp.]
MNDFRQTENFTVFGGFYPAETHSRNRIARRSRAGSVGPLAAVLVALVLGATTTAGAITATKRIHATNYGFSLASYSKIPGVPHFQDALY